jgi:Undecaprenyl-phosphate glucose phosphotransferase
MPEARRWTGLTLDRVRSERAADAAATERPPPLGEAAARIAASLRRPALAPEAIGLAVRALDAAALAAAFWFAQFGALGPGFETPAATATALALALVAVTGIGLAGGYRVGALRRFSEGMARAGVAVALVAAAPAALGQWGDAAPLGFGAALVAAGLALAPLRAGAAAFADWAVAAGATERRAVVVGGGTNAERLIRGLAARPDNDIRIVGIFDDRGDDRSPPLVAGVPKLGAVAELVAFGRAAAVDMMIVTLPLSAEKRILSLLATLWVLPLDVRLSAYSADYQFPRRDAPALIDVMPMPISRGARLAKRALDVVAGSAALLALSPVMALTALAIRLDSPGPVFFRQKRHGFNNAVVEVLKFRSMYVERCDPEGRTIVTKGDPRVTRVGRLIRKTSIDELPQLFNVLTGALSLVGPRPHAVIAKSSREETFSQIVEGYSGRHKVPPGITGWAQVNGWRGEVDDPEQLRRRFEHDLYYIENWSLWLDLKILLRTPFSLFRTEHAY